MKNKVNTSYDVIVVGGGAAGMMAAGRAAERGLSVLVVEKNQSLGVKLSQTGGGRCNITNAEFDNRLLLVNYGEAETFLHSTFARFSVGDTFAFFEERGVPLVVEERQRAFPHTQRARDVTRVLQDYLSRGKVEVLLSTSVQSLITQGGELVGVQTSKGGFRAEHVVLATGGLSHSKTGSTGEGFQWLRDIGHTVMEPNPNVVPLKVKEAWVKKLSGTSLEDVTVTFAGGDGGQRISKTGRVLFTHFGLSGPMILNSAHDVKEMLTYGPVKGTIDLYPTDEIQAVDKQVLASFAKHRSKLVRNCLKPLCPAGMVGTLVLLMDETVLNKQVSQVSQAERKRLVRLLKGLPFTVTGTMGYDWAVISDGGVPLTEVDTRSMASRLYPNLYIIGDLLHINRPSGGYSLQLCWTTGWVVGSSVGRSDGLTV